MREDLRTPLYGEWQGLMQFLVILTREGEGQAARIRATV